MANSVFANGREVACKAGAGKTICAFPDVCMTPPQTPATPPGVPIPYPNTGLASDTTDGTKSVKISGEEVGQKDISCFKKSSGDEAGSAPKKGIKSSKNTGKVYFTSWSSDVKFEGENAVRHLDTTTNNHGSNANEALPWAFIDKGVFAKDPDCEEDKKAEEKACEDYTPKGTKDACADAGLNESFPNSDAIAISAGYKSKEDFGNQMAKRAKAKNKAAKCINARKCRLVPYDPKKKYGNVAGCCPSQTPDHVVPKSSFFKDKFGGTPMPGWENYEADAAPCMCLEGGSTSGSHGIRHTYHKSMAPAGHPATPSFNTEADHCAQSASYAAPHCDPDCLAKQIKAGHEQQGDRRTKVTHSPTGSPATDSQLADMQKYGRGLTRS